LKEEKLIKNKLKKYLRRTEHTGARIREKDKIV